MVFSHRLRTKETLEERQGRGGLEGRHHVAGEANRGEAKVLRRRVSSTQVSKPESSHAHGSRVNMGCDAEWCTRSAHLVWRAGHGVRGDVACRRLARLGLEIPAVRGHGPVGREEVQGRGVGARTRAATHPLPYYPLLATGYWLLTAYQGRHASFSVSTPLVSSEVIHSSLPMYGTHASASPAARIAGGAHGKQCVP